MHQGILAAALVVTAATGDIWTVGEWRASSDPRTTLERSTNTVFAVNSFHTLADWEAYAEQLRRQILVSSGLWPLPERTPLNARVFDRVERDGYSVAKVHFEAFPGFLVTGNLYRPAGDGPFPGVICPHGHWANGRLEEGERGSVPARSITFARMGIAAFSYDMVGYVDSRQFDFNWSHSWGSVPESQRFEEHLWGLHPFALQLWAAIRALDFMESLDDVDGERLGCTGASGGGTQTFILSAIDRRVRVAAPVNMISHTMQGGCVCENAPLIRLNASNMEIGALYAPNPLLLVSATGDWTRETPEVEYPAIRGIYDLYGHADRVHAVLYDAPHNYNLDSREAVYRHFGRYLLEDPESYADFTEPEYPVEADETLRVLPGDGVPEGHLDQAALTKRFKGIVRSKWEQELPRTYTDALPFRQKHRGAFAGIFGIDPESPPTAESAMLRTIEKPAYTVRHYVLTVGATGGIIPMVTFTPHRAVSKFPVLVVHGKGKAALEGPMGGPGALIDSLLREGRLVAAIDPFLVGQMEGDRLAQGFPDTFLPTTTAHRVQDIIAAARWLREIGRMHSVDLVGLDEAGVWSVFAAAFEPGVARTVADLNGFNPDDDSAWVTRHYVPCVRSLGDIRTAAYFIAPRGLYLMNAAPAYDIRPIQSAFLDTGSRTSLAIAGHAKHERIVEALR